MPKKPAKKVASKKPRLKSFSTVLEATGLDQLKPIKPTRKAPAAAPVKTKVKAKVKAKPKAPSSRK
jgi:hypothetical protein